MLDKRKFIATALGGIILVRAGISSALADCSSGFIANTLCQAGVINRQTANGLDAAHAAAGRPLDHIANQAAGAAANWVVPGSGVYVTQGLELRDQWNRSGVGVQMAPPIAPPIRTQMGNICYTQAGPYFGPFNPVGVSCVANTPWGMVQGVVGL